MGRARTLIDVEPLRSRDFRLLFASQLAAVAAGQLTLVALAFEVYALTRSSFQVGLISLVQLGPLVAGALAGGPIGDRVDRRRVLVCGALGFALAAGALACNAASGRGSIWVAFGAGAVGAGVAGVASTVSNATVGTLVGPRDLVAAYATMQVVDQIAMIAAPALAGLLISQFGLPWLYGLVVLLSMFGAAAAARLSPSTGISPTVDSAGSVRDGLRYLHGRQVLQGAYLIDLNATVFGLPRALFPAMATAVFHGGAGTLGLLYAAPGAGALVGAVTTGWVGRIRRQARAITVAVGVWGGAIVAFGFVRWLWLGLSLLVVAGWSDVISAVLRSAVLQSSVPEAYRARISSVQIAVVEGGPRIGDLEAGAVASLSSTGVSIVSGGLACMAGAVILMALLPSFRRYRSPHDPDADPLHPAADPLHPAADPP